MRSKSKSASRMDANPYHISPSVTCSEPWWRNTNYNSISPAVIGGNASNSSLMEQSKNGQSQSDGELGESDDDAINESQITASPHSGIDGNYGLDHQNSQPQTSAIPPSNESLIQPPQLELVGHSIACASNPYSYPYYGGMMAAYGSQPWVPPPHLLDIYHGRMPLPLEMAQEPVYVNAKQYHGILRRRQLRAKAEAEKKLIKARKPYLHESRHQHAMRRARVSGGRFAKKSNFEDLKCPAAKTGPGSAISSHSASSSGSEPLRCETVETRNHHESKGHEVQETYETQGYADDNVQYQSHNTYGAHPAKGGGGDPSDQQWGNVSSNKASQRALAIKGKHLCPT